MIRSPPSFLLLVVCLFSTTKAQDSAVPVPDPDSDFYQEGSPFINFPGCFSDLITADVNGDGVVKSSEYLGFIQEYGKRKCIENPVLTWQQRIAFNNIACQCRSELGSTPDCCLAENAQIRTTGALNPSRTGEQSAYLTSACRLTDATLPPYACPPRDDTREAAPLPPLPPVFLPPVPAAAAADRGLPREAMWAIIAVAALLLLMLLLCCCVCAAKKKKEVEEEEIEETETLGKGLPGDVDEETPSSPVPEQYVPVAPLVAAASIPMAREPEPEMEDIIEEEEEESEDEEEGRKRTGGGPLGEEDDEEGMKRFGGGRFPPPEKEDPGFKLRPIEIEKEEDPNWDHPGRPIEEPKSKTEDEGQVFEPYIPDGGVYIPERPPKNPVEYDPQWERGEKEEPDDIDKRKHRIQSGLGEAAVWDQLDAHDTDGTTGGGGGLDAFDWVIQSALGVLDKTDDNYMTSSPTNNKDEPQTET